MSEQNKEGEKKEVKGYINEEIISNRDQYVKYEEIKEENPFKEQEKEEYNFDSIDFNINPFRR